MKTNWIKKALSVVLAGAMVICLSATAGVPMAVHAEETEGGGKYVSDVFIAYGKTEKKATEWLQKNGWEPIKGDFNAGKASFFDDNKVQDQNVAAVMGIKRTDDKNNAVTDMAVMNMKGGYSIPDYEQLLEEKKGQIDEVVNGMKPILSEYRQNLEGKGSSYGKKRAEFAYNLLNKFLDGDPEGVNAVNDTGLELGKLFAEKTMQEGNENGGDLQQMMLESSGPAMLAVETLLAMAADTGEESWLDRASGLTGDELSENLAKYVPEAEGRDVADSEVPQYLNEKYGDTATILANQYEDVHEDIAWFEAYNEENGLWQEDGESDEDYAARVEKYLADLRSAEAEENSSNSDSERYSRVLLLYNRMYEFPYKGEWGETLGDFLNPVDDTFSTNTDNFLPLAAGLSDGQRAGLNYLSFEMMLLIGLGTEEGLDLIAPDLKGLLGEATEIDVFTGVNREAFRGGVALTSEALMEQNAGKGQAFDKIWDNMGIVAITSYAAACVGAVTLGAGAYMTVKGVEVVGRSSEETIARLTREFEDATAEYNRIKGLQEFGQVREYEVTNAERAMNRAQESLNKAKGTEVTTRMGTAGRWMLGIGGAILVGAAIVKAVQMYKYYQRDMTPIPRMIVDESDIVTYLTDDNGKPLLDEKGNQKKTIDFKTYEYYSAVKCNRPEVGEIGDWQDGVSDYKDPKHYCYDIADLNADMGQEWIALYTVKSQDKGDPILADSLTLQYGSNKTPDGCTKGLHLFTYTNAVDLGDTAWAFNNDKKGVYFFWDEDTNAFATDAASAFSGGHLALAGFGGLILGIAGATLVLNKKRKEDEPEAA